MLCFLACLHSDRVFLSPHPSLCLQHTHTQASDADFCVDVLNGLVAADAPVVASVLPPGTIGDKRGLWENGSAAAAGSSARGEDLDMDETEAHLGRLAALYVQSQHQTLGAGAGAGAGTGTGTGTGAGTAPTAITRGNAWWSVAAVQRVLLIFALNAKRAWVLRLRARTSLAVYAFIHVVMAAGTSCVCTTLTRSVPVAPAELVLFPPLPSPPVHTHTPALSSGFSIYLQTSYLSVLTPPVAAPFQPYYPTGTLRVATFPPPHIPRIHCLFLCAHCSLRSSAAQFRAAQCARHWLPTVAVLHECGHRKVGLGHGR